MLQVLTVLVKFGYYDDSKDVNELLPSILTLLNGKDDFPTKRVKEFCSEGTADVQARREYTQKFYYCNVNVKAATN